MYFVVADWSGAAVVRPNVLPLPTAADLDDRVRADDPRQPCCSTVDAALWAAVRGSLRARLGGMTGGRTLRILR